MNAKNLTTHGSGGGGVANAKPKYPPDASGGYNKYKLYNNQWQIDENLDHKLCPFSTM